MRAVRACMRACTLAAETMLARDYERELSTMIINFCALLLFAGIVQARARTRTPSAVWRPPEHSSRGAGMFTTILKSGIN